MGNVPLVRCSYKSNILREHKSLRPITRKVDVLMCLRQNRRSPETRQCEKIPLPGFQSPQKLGSKKSPKIRIGFANLLHQVMTQPISITLQAFVIYLND